MGGQNGGALDQNCGAFCKEKLLALFGAFRKNNGASQFETVNNTAAGKETLLSSQQMLFIGAKKEKKILKKVSRHQQQQSSQPKIFFKCLLKI